MKTIKPPRGALKIARGLRTFTLILSLLANFLPVTAYAAVWTDKADYSPGEIVTISGDNSNDAGYLPGETVHVSVVGPNDYLAECEGTADENGAWSCQVTLWDSPDAYGTYTYTAIGAQSLVSENGTFTDAPPSLQQLWQCDPPSVFDPSTYTCVSSGPNGWVTGNNDGPFAEGDTVPYRTRMQNMVNGNNYSITIEWDTTQGGKHALDYLKSFNATIASAQPCASLTGLPAGLCSVAPSTFAIPSDTFMQSSADWIANAGVQDPGVFTMYGGTLTGVSAYTTPPNYSGNTKTSITVYFTANSTDIVMAWGGHIAERDDWGLNNSAVAISGSPYHMRILTFFDNTNNSSLNVGNTDRSLSAEAVIYPGSVTIIKQATPEGATSFAFTASPSPLTNFSLVDDGTAMNTKVFGNIKEFKTYSVAETVPSGWSLSSIVCTVTSPNGGSQTVSLPSVSINLKEGENVTCTFTNQVIPAPSLSLLKQISTSASGPWSSSITVAGGSSVYYQFTINNTGNVPLSPVSVSDPTLSGEESCVFTDPLPVGGTTTCVVGPVTAANPAGTYQNTATAHGGYGGTTYDSQPSTAEYVVAAAPAIDVEKYVSIDGGVTWEDADAAPGPYVNDGTDPEFKFVVTNIGNVELANVDVTDDVFGDISLDGTLAVGASAEYFVTDAIWAEGQHTNTATASGDYDNVTYSDTDDANYFGSNPEIDVEKYVSVDGGTTWVDADTAPGPYLNAGTDPQFKFVVTNVGNVELTNVDVTDDVFGDISLDGTLAVGASAEYFVTDAIWAEGQHTNTATASGDFTDGNGNTETDTDSDAANYFGVIASIDVEKYVSIDGGVSWVDADTATGPYLIAGADPQFKFVVTNVGNVELTNVDVTDDVFGDISLDGTLAVGASAEYFVTDAIWAEGQHTNTATASGDFGGMTYTDTDDANYYGSNAEIDVEKYVSIDGGLTWVDADTATGPYLNAGTDPQFKFVVTNVGNVDLSNVDVADDVFGDISLGGTLAVGGSAEYFVTGAWAAGQHTNTATASGDFIDDNGNTETDTDTDAANYYGAAPALELTKTGAWEDGDADGYADPGEAINYTFEVCNIGNVTLNNVTVVDSVGGVTVSGGPLASLAVGACDDTTFTGVYYITQADIDAGHFYNVATADSDESEPADGDEDVTLPQNPAIGIVKSLASYDDNDESGDITSGDGLWYQFLVTNEGNVTLTGVGVTDDTFSIGVTCPVTVLDPGASTTCTADAAHTVTLAEANAGNVHNEATATGTPPTGPNVTDTDDLDSPVVQHPAISIVKTTSDDFGNEGDAIGILPGENVTWMYVVTNEGDVTLSNVIVTDDQLGVINCVSFDGTLDPGESVTCIASGIAEEDPDGDTIPGGWYQNLGTADGESPKGQPVEDSDPSSYYALTPGAVTNSSLCDFGDQFRLIFTPDMGRYTSSTPYYKLSDSNPGQFFYNVFYANDGSTDTITLEIPYPFVTQGANPVHVYGGLFVNESGGYNCFDPTSELAARGLVFGLDDYIDTNGDGGVGYGDVYLVDVPAELGFQYINIHLDYGLEKTDGWLRKGANATSDGTGKNPAPAGVSINDNTAHTFNAYADGVLIDGSTDTVYNLNEFKQIRGFGGLVQVEGSLDPVEGAEVQLIRDGTVIETMTTDGDGWYLSEYIHKGKAATYTLRLLAGTDPNGDPYVQQEVTDVLVGGKIKFGEGNFLVP